MKHRCSKCGEERKFSDFRGARSECRICRNAEVRDQYAALVEAKVCPKCREPVRADRVVCEVCIEAVKSTPSYRRAHRRREENGESAGRMDGKLKPADLVACTKCGLRGHEAGDPAKCLGPVWSFGHSEGGTRVHGRVR